MKASELVVLLNTEIEKYGDLEVKYLHLAGEKTPDNVVTYNEYGNTATDVWPAVEIYIH